VKRRTVEIFLLSQEKKKKKRESSFNAQKSISHISFDCCRVQKCDISYTVQNKKQDTCKYEGENSMCEICLVSSPIQQNGLTSKKLFEY
jgi:hypothetical protein